MARNNPNPQNPSPMQSQGGGAGSGGMSSQQAGSSPGTSSQSSSSQGSNQGTGAQTGTSQSAPGQSTPGQSASGQSASGQGAGTSSQPSSGTQSSAASGTRTATADRERGIATSRETSGGPMTRQGGPGGLAQSGQVSPLTSPFTMMRRLAEDMDRMFGDFGLGGLGLFPTFSSTGRQTGRRATRTSADLDRMLWTPTIDVLQRGDNLVIRADLPGVSKENVSVELDNGVLIISGETEQDREEDRSGYFRSERVYGSFYRAIPLPDDIDVSQAEATFHDGVLEIVIPNPQKPEQSRSRKIDVKG
jgi:HSP20 family protein